MEQSSFDIAVFVALALNAFRVLGLEYVVKLTAFDTVHKNYHSIIYNANILTKKVIEVVIRRSRTDVYNVIRRYCTDE